ncbi:formyltetrahydrofolate deformylase [Pedosphaera parvula]|uniref:Formyl transferase domain protein n=1 Tax=Pedosphaera parvula (strain Ellin514) TaxID=320771 RepID=B9XAP0_PEDPL|nr:formyltetrahydrofolate deformylase [Pedosphaera parvula]EEF63075.1 formyl transferase domain protein [Pedosphaera parvula Ellin514]
MTKMATITVIGRDKAGVVARVTKHLFEGGANIEALEEQVTRGQFSMVIQASWELNQFSLAMLQSGLCRLAQQLEMEISVHVTEPHQEQRMALMVTREPHCLEALLSNHRLAELKAIPSIVLSNCPDLEPIARENDVPFAFVPWHERKQGEREALAILQKHNTDFIVLARFMKVLSHNFVWRYPKKIINIHPSLLPSFPGAQAYRQAWERGVKIIGVTAHFVTMDLDEGPIIAQGSFSVQKNMRLPDIIKEGQKHEAHILTQAVNLYLSKQLEISWGIVSEIDKSENNPAAVSKLIARERDAGLSFEKPSATKSLSFAGEIPMPPDGLRFDGAQFTQRSTVIFSLQAALDSQ